MKKLILALIISLNIFSISARTLTRKYTTDKETGEAVVIETYEDEKDDVIERRIQGSELPVARIIKSIYSPDNEYEYTYSVTYNINLKTGIFDKKEFFYNEKSIRKYSVTTIKKEGEKLFLVANTDFKAGNNKNIAKTEDTYTFEESARIKTIVYYDQNDEVSQTYWEYGKDEQPVYVREEYRINSEGLKSLEDYYSYPDYTFESNNSYLQIKTFENNPHGLLKLVHTENPDGTYVHEYYLDITKRNLLFTKYVSKYSKERKELYSEQYYEKQLYKGKVYKIIEYRDENDNVASTFYYDKDGKEIPKSELDIKE